MAMAWFLFQHIRHPMDINRLRAAKRIVKIAKKTPFSFLSVGRNRNTIQFGFLEGRKLRKLLCDIIYIDEFFSEKLVNRNWILDPQNFSYLNSIFC